MGNIDEARENCENDYLDSRDRQWQDDEAIDQENTDKNIQNLAYDIDDSTDDILYDIKHHDKKSFSDDLNKVINLEYDDVNIPTDVSLNDDFSDLVDALGQPSNKEDFQHSVMVLKQYHNDFDNHSTDTSIFLNL